MEYMLEFSATSMTDIVEKINDRLADGWIPQGGIAVVSHIFEQISPDEHSIFYVQALTKL